MTTEELKRKLRDEISEREREIDNLREQLSEIYMKEAGDFSNSYVKYIDDGGKYHFMRVDYQDVAYPSACLILGGSILRLDADPLDEDFTAYDIDNVSYENYAEVHVMPIVFKENGVAKVTRITKEDYETAVERCLGSIRENALMFQHPESQ